MNIAYDAGPKPAKGSLSRLVDDETRASGIVHRPNLMYAAPLEVVQSMSESMSALDDRRQGVLCFHDIGRDEAKLLLTRAAMHGHYGTDWYLTRASKGDTVVSYTVDTGDGDLVVKHRKISQTTDGSYETTKSGDLRVSRQGTSQTSRRSSSRRTSSRRPSTTDDHVPLGLTLVTAVKKTVAMLEAKLEVSLSGLQPNAAVGQARTVPTGSNYDKLHGGRQVDLSGQDQPENAAVDSDQSPSKHAYMNATAFSDQHPPKVAYMNAAAIAGQKQPEDAYINAAAITDQNQPEDAYMNAIAIVSRISSEV